MTSEQQKNAPPKQRGKSGNSNDGSATRARDIAQ
jgi:hypothetical protein